MDSALFDCKKLLKIDPPAITEAAVWAIGRIADVRGNTSRRDPRWFSQTVNSEADSVSGFADGMAGIHRRFSIPVLGGCCRTRSAHIEALAQRLRSRVDTRPG